MRIAIGFGWTTPVATEIVAANVGPGQMVLIASNFLRTDIVAMGLTPSASSPAPRPVNALGRTPAGALEGRM